MNKVIVVLGPTGVGKTKMSVELAKIYNGEIINADAMQVYKDLNIGTAKIREDEKENIPHHLFDIKNVDEEYSIYAYQKDCRLKIDEVLSKGKTPIIVGGTGLYIKGALYDYKLDETNKEDNANYDDIKTEDLYNELIKLDNKSINKIDKNNRRRIINAIKHYKNTNTSITENITDKLLYDSIFIGLTTNRDNLYNIINERVNKMVDAGLVEEVKSFYSKGLYTKPLTGGIGYKELYNYFEGNSTLDEALELIKRNSRRYAKRQYTFFNNKMDVVWFNTDYNNFSNTVKEVSNYIDSKLNI